VDGAFLEDLGDPDQKRGPEEVGQWITKGAHVHDRTVKFCSEES